MGETEGRSTTIREDSDRCGGGSECCGFTRRVLITIGLVIAAVIVLAFLWFAIDVLLLLFAAALLAVFLRSLSDWLSQRTRLPQGWALAVVIFALLGVVVVGAWLIAPDVAGQADQLKESIPRAVERVSERLESYGWGRQLLEQLPPKEDLISGRTDLLARVTGVFSTTLGVLANFLIIIIVGLYLAVQPDLYTRGFIRLFHETKRARVREVLEGVGTALRGWLLGKLITMTIVGVLTTVGLWLLGVPLALTLGLIAFGLAFIPNIGPLLSVIPAVASALMVSPIMVLYVLILYVGIQSIESYLLNPLVYKQTLQLPPGLTIAAQVLLGVLFGAVGIALATPLTAVAVVLVRMLYVEVAADADADSSD